MSDVKLQIADDVREAIETRGIRDEDISAVISNAEETGDKLYREDRFLSKLVIEEATYYVEYSVADGGTYTIHTAYTHRAKLEEE